MSTLIVDELYPNTVFAQRIWVRDTINVTHIRPWIYKQGTLVDGEMICRIKSDLTTIATATLTFEEINAANTSTYSHGFIRFDFNTIILEHKQWNVQSQPYTDYIIEFEMINHTKDITNFVGVCRSWDRETYPPVYPSTNSMVTPVGLEIYTYKEKL